MKASLIIPALIGTLIIANAAELRPKLSNNLHELYLEDQKDRGEGGKPLPWEQIELRDRKRRASVHKLLEGGALKTAEDFHDAAFIYQHGETADDYLMAHILGTVAVAKGDSTSLWITAATLDRYLTTSRQAQVFGTQYNSSENSKYTQEPFQRTLIPDQLRAVFCVPSLEQQQKNVAEFDAGKYPTHIISEGCTR